MINWWKYFVKIKILKIKEYSLFLRMLILNILQ